MSATDELVDDAASGADVTPASAAEASPASAPEAAPDELEQEDGASSGDADEIEQADDDELEAGGDDDTPASDERCDAEVNMSTGRYRCALTLGHAGEHAFTAVAADDEAATDADAGAPQTEAEIEKARKQLANEAIRHRNRLGEIMGSDADELVPCVLCSPSLAGWRYDVAPDEAVTKAVRVVIGLPDLENYRPSPTEAVCDTCGGLGRVRTFSLVAGEEHKKCDPCNGRGWVTTRARTNPDDAIAPSSDGGESAPAPIDDGIRRDMFGTPEGDPDFEKLPGARIRPVDYWQTNRE